MKVRPSKEYFCDICEAEHTGTPKQTEPIFYVGCCFDLEWQGTREQAGDLYDYLVGAGLLGPRRECTNGCIDFDGDMIGEGQMVWICGECDERYAEQKLAVECCRAKEEARKAELMEEEGV